MDDTNNSPHETGDVEFQVRGAGPGFTGADFEALAARVARLETVQPVGSEQIDWGGGGFIPDDSAIDGVS